MDRENPFPEPLTSTDSKCYVELTVQGGKYHGKSHKVKTGLAIIGRDASCTIRLDSPEIRPIHCVVVQTPEGLLLRSAHSTATFRVNDQSVTNCLLHEKDTLTIGPITFQISKLVTTKSEDALKPVPQAEELQALRVQSTVSAQQQDLAEQERRIDEKQQSWSRQEEQLAVHLEERRLKILSQKEELRRDRAKFKEEKQASEHQFEQAWADIKASEIEVENARKQTGKERQRLIQLRRRFKQRFRRHQAHLERELAQKEQSLLKKQQALEAKLATIEQDYRGVQNTRLKHNGEIELQRRQIEDGWHELEKARAAWKEEQAAKQAKLHAQQEAIGQQLRQLTEAQQALVIQQSHSQKIRDHLEIESRGLEARAKSLQAQVHDLEQQSTDAGNTVGNHWQAPDESTQSEKACAPAELEETVELLEKLLLHQEDQRRQLQEQWAQFLSEQEQWQQEHAVLLPEVERMIEELDTREHQIKAREYELDQESKSLQAKREELSCKEFALDAVQSRWKVKEVEWHAERSKLLCEVQLRETLLKKEREDLAQLREKWKTNRHKEVESLKTHLRNCQAAHRCYVKAMEHHQEEIAELASQKQRLTEQSLALEELRSELLGQSEDSIQSEKKIRRLEKEWNKAYKFAREELEEQQSELKKELERLQEMSHSLQTRSQTVLSEETQLASTWSEMEQAKHIFEQEQFRQAKEILSLRQKEEHARQWAEKAQQELESIVSTLLRDNAPVESSLKVA